MLVIPIAGCDIGSTINECCSNGTMVSGVL